MHLSRNGCLTRISRLAGLVTLVFGVLAVVNEPVFAGNGKRLEALAMVGALASRTGVDPHLAIAIAMAESGGDPETRDSRAGAVGLMQVVPQQAGADIGIADPRQLRKPKVSAYVGVAYLSRLSSRFDRNLWLVSAAYNAGPGTVRTWMNRYGIPCPSSKCADRWRARLPYSETRVYLGRVKRYVLRLRQCSMETTVEHCLSRLFERN